MSDSPQPQNLLEPENNALQPSGTPTDDSQRIDSTAKTPPRGTAIPAMADAALPTPPRGIPVMLPYQSPTPMMPFEEDVPPQRGCGSTLLGLLLTLMVLFMMVATVAIAGFAGYRDGGILRQTQRSEALVGTAQRQETLASNDLGAGQYSLARSRCEYLITLQPFNQNAVTCLATAQAGLVMTATPTPAPPTTTPTMPPPTQPTVNASGGNAGFTAEELFLRGQTAARSTEWESAIAWFEALRALDGTFRRQEVETALVEAYTALGSQYRYEARYSEMIVVIEKALKIRSLADTDWGFTVNAAKIYLSARNYLDAGSYALAAQDFARLMEIAPQFSSDTRTLACEAFSKAGDSANASRFCQ
ncbi:MAG: hypothetical protein OHK0023_10630 [Anaerolineae bacterium]